MTIFILSLSGIEVQVLLVRAAWVRCHGTKCPLLVLAAFFLLSLQESDPTSQRITLLCTLDTYKYVFVWLRSFHANSTLVPSLRNHSSQRHREPPK